jgi:hypothetical protein
MKLKLSFTIVALVSCLAILLAVVVQFPRSVHASEDASLHHASAPTITVSPADLNLSPCSYVNTNNYILCPVTLSVNQPLTKKLDWTSSYKATLCFYNTCGPDYDVAVLPSQGSLNAGYTSVQVSIIVSDYCYHGHANATITFAIQGGSMAKVKYSCTSID